MAAQSNCTFISYAHYPTLSRHDHMREEERSRQRQRVLSLSNILRSYGVDTVLDQYHEDDPPDSWPMWMEENIRHCKWVLMVCTESYYHHITGKSAESNAEDGRGSRFEGKTIYGLLTDESQARKFIPVFLDKKDLNWLPASLKGGHYYDLKLPDIVPKKTMLENEEFRKLYARLTGQNRTPKPPVGGIVHLPSKKSAHSVAASDKSSQCLTVGHRQLDHPSDEKVLLSVGVNKLSKLFNPDLTGKPKQTDLVKLSKQLGYHWKELAFALGFSQANVDDFEYASRSLSEQAFQMLLSWTRKYGSRATWEELGTVLTDIGQQEISYSLDV